MEMLEKIKGKLTNECYALREEYDSLAAQFDSKTLLEKYQAKIQLEKISNRLEVLDRAINYIELKCTLPYYIASASQNAIVPPKSINAMLKSTLEETYAQLDISTAKKFLVTEFYTERIKGFAKYNLLLGIFGGAMFGMCFTALTWIIYNDLLLMPLALPIVGAFGMSFFQVKSVKRKIAVFESLNKELGDNAIAHEMSDLDEELTELEEEIETQISALVVAEVQQREYQAQLDSFGVEELSQNTLTQPMELEHLPYEEIPRWQIIARLEAEKAILTQKSTPEVANQYTLK